MLGFCTVGLGLVRVDLPLVLVVVISLIVGLLMVVVFRYTSDQKAIHIAKDHLKAHLLAVRLFQDQLSVVLSSYGRILAGTGRYLRLAFKPLLFVIVPLILLIVQLDQYLGSMPLQPGQAFLVKVRTDNADSLNEVLLQLPPEMTVTAPAVHVLADNEVIWRVVAQKDVLVSGEPALPDNSPIQSIEVSYPSRSIYFAWLEWNWIWLFFVLSLVAGFFFKSVLGIEI